MKRDNDTLDRVTLPAWHKWAIIITVMLVATIEVLDSTVVNVSLPSMMNSLGANSHQITWVLTSYLVSAAIFIPMTGFLERLLGRRQLLLVSIAGFLVTSMACGMATSLGVMVLGRILQGVFGATLIPLSQAVLKDTFSDQEQGKAMAIWGVGIMVTPIIGPTLGAFITEYMNWRWIFYMNLPICAVGFFMAWSFIPYTRPVACVVDWAGALFMALGAGCLQLFLDRGAERDWFTSDLIIGLFAVSVCSIVYFIYRSRTHPHPIVHLALCGVRSFTLSTLILSVYVSMLFSCFTFQPLFLQHLYHYPTLTVGLLMAPRGLAAAVVMAMTPLLMRCFDLRIILATGIVLSAMGTYYMSIVNLQASFWQLTWPGVLQGIGMGCIFPPLSAYALFDIPKNQVAEASGLFSYGRMLGASMGISLMGTFLSNHVQYNWHRLASAVHPYRGDLPALWGVPFPLKVQWFAYQVGMQAHLIAFLSLFLLAALILCAILPLILLLKGGGRLRRMAAKTGHETRVK